MLAFSLSNLDEITDTMQSWVWSIPLFLLLLGCGLLFSVISKFIQWRVLAHGYSCIRGHYDKPDDTGHINHFQALCAALSATIGLGNIAGVALAVSLGGPGAIFWMWIVGLFGMALKFMECSLAVMYRDVRDVPDPSAPALVEADAEDGLLDYPGQVTQGSTSEPQARGEVRGGPMWYIQKALVEPLRARGNALWVVFKVLAVLFALATILNSFGGGNMFQGWNVSDQLKSNFNIPVLPSAVVMSILVGLVIIGGIKRIGQVASKLVPFMCVIYVLGSLVVILAHVSEVPYYIALIVKSAFTPTAGGGAFTGVTVWIAFQHGLRRACFSNEAGEGSAAMAHAAAKTDEPIREGIVAGIGPFVDTIIICTMSALVLLISGAWNRPAVGTVATIGPDSVVVACASELPDKMEPLYLDRIVEGNELAIHVLRAQDKKLETVAAPISAVERGPGEGWAGLKSITLDLSDSDITPEDREKFGSIALDQPVHLNITGSSMTSFAFDTSFKGFGKYMVTLGVCLFAFSTMISWSYYGEKGTEYLLGPQAILPYKMVFVIFVFLGMVLEKFQYVYNFSDATTGLMVLCNLPAVLVLSPAVLRAAKDYFHRLDTGVMPRLK